MKLINQSAEYLPQGNEIEGIYKQIELAGRTSYLSWDKMTDDSAKKFVDMLIKSKHTSVLEHGTVYLTERWKTDNDNFPESKFKHNPYSKVIELYPHQHNKLCYITTNFRVLQENNWLDDLKYLCEPTEFHEKRLSVKVITDIGVTREFNRHRTFSIVEQSTRYCNFSKDKLGKEITFIKPSWYIDGDCENKYAPIMAEFEDGCYRAEGAYFSMLYKGAIPQEARQVLPLSTKTEVVYTAFESDWRHFFDLRLFGKTGEPHPQMKQLAELIKQEFEKAGVWEGIMKYPSKYE